MYLLIILAIENDEDRYFIAQLYKQYYPLMKKKAYEILHDYSVIDDLINDAFIKLIGKISILRSLECYKRTSYIVNTIRNISINYNKQYAAKSEKMFLGMSDDLMESIPDMKFAMQEICSTKDDYIELGEAMEQLSKRDRDLLYNKYNLELSDKEIADIMGISLNNIREYLTRARRRAFKILTRREDENEK
ncbi:RNA polymerase, sigma-24 subunit, ECF subfamily [Syntrophobotulus glycolicus DSM 8271]|uniref:RNA polymerase, sigma-24 subunit, ECF subfamily n=1 Tax=Syntrophobotulus glycolicus (strain DSM 8271 / FlGlyR) TaxID=645991 RepID=F0SVJ8_SYNGF|nr:sigma-70 family RNA polymerase sigma factor [Syntrophobotulus glycolicus]ADY54474.1 RNA polymerase, sigma-24 subunit, ECF subfamily [Syntrophobotulus glycolicus DSM 8271]